MSDTGPLVRDGFMPLSDSTGAIPVPVQDDTFSTENENSRIVHPITSSLRVKITVSGYERDSLGYHPTGEHFSGTVELSNRYNHKKARQWVERVIEEAKTALF